MDKQLADPLSHSFHIPGMTAKVDPSVKTKILVV